MVGTNMARQSKFYFRACSLTWDMDDNVRHGERVETLPERSWVKNQICKTSEVDYTKFQMPRRCLCYEENLICLGAWYSALKTNFQTKIIPRLSSTTSIFKSNIEKRYDVRLHFNHLVAVS
ncbi:hypothetical protein EAF00_009460 [Botryotinia globosa]|nr:hypothetical protein EAF00_009460 [Botryotinia globosa]